MPGSKSPFGTIPSWEGSILLPKHRLLGPFELSFDTRDIPVGFQQGSKTAMPLTELPACGQLKWARVIWHYKKVNSGHFRKYLAFACCGKAWTDRSPTLAVVFDSFPPQGNQGTGFILPHFQACSSWLRLEHASSWKLLPPHSSLVIYMKWTGNLNPVPSSSDY